MSRELPDWTIVGWHRLRGAVYGRPMDIRNGRGKALVTTGALAAGLFSLGCVPAEQLPEVPPVAADAAGAVPVTVTQQPGGQIVLGSADASAPGTAYDYLVVGGPLAAPVEGSFDPAGTATPGLADGQYTAAVTATDASGVTGTGTVQFTVEDGRLIA